jgi:hypothetical protein
MTKRIIEMYFLSLEIYNGLLDEKMLGSWLLLRDDVYQLECVL